MKVEVQDLVTVIQGLGRRFEYFHLSPCICGAPMWQKPCRVCGHYPQFNDDRIIEARTGESPHKHLRNTCTKENYSKIVSSAGHFLEYYLRGFYYAVDPQYDKLDSARDLAKNFVWPSAEEIWDYYRRDDVDSMGRIKPIVNRTIKERPLTNGTKIKIATSS